MTISKSTINLNWTFFVFLPVSILTNFIRVLHVQPVLPLVLPLV